MFRAVATMVAAAAVACGSSDLQKAAERSQRQPDRPLVIMATASWCGPCQQFKKYVLPAPQVQEALRDVQFVMLHEGESDGSLAQLGVRSFPTFLVVRPDQKVVAAVRGRMGAARFVDFLRWGTPNWFTEEELRRQLADAPSPRIRIYAARWYALHGDLARAGGLYQAALAGLGDAERSRRASVTWEMILVGSAGKRADHLVARARELIARFPRSGEVAEAGTLVLLSGVLPADERRSFGRELIGLLGDNPQALNGLTYDLLAADLPDLAVAAAERQVELAPDDANAYDTLAEARNYAGDRSGALRAADQAIARASASDSRATYEKNRKRFAAGRRLPSISSAEQVARIFARYHIRH